MLRFFDMFSGVGGFRAGLERAGGFTCIGHCEIDKYADRAYRAAYNIKESEVYYENANKIDTNTLPDFDVLCGGFPCQAFSVAGKRKGFEDVRGTLFFEIARVAQAKRPQYLLLENVPGLLSHDKGRTFAVILSTINELGYSVEWQVLNSKNFGVPQSRRRVYIIGYLDARCAGKILPIREANQKTLMLLAKGRNRARIYDPSGLSNTLVTKAGGYGGNTGLYAVMTPERALVRQNGRRIKRKEEPMFALTAQDRHGVLMIKEATKSGGKAAFPGDSVDLAYAGTNTRRGRVGRNIAHTLTVGGSQGVLALNGRVRRLLPRECFRLQGFSEEQIDKFLAVNSDTQSYKQSGNAVTANVIHALGLRLKAAHKEIERGTV